MVFLGQSWSSREMLSDSLMHLQNPFTTYRHVGDEKSLLMPALKDILKIAHPNLVIRPEALAYVESRLQYVLGLLCAEQPHTISDVDARINNVFPNSFIQMSINYAQRKKKPLLPVAKLHPVIQRDYLSGVRDKDCSAVTAYLCGILEFLASEILRVAGKYIMNIRHAEITEEDVKVSVFADKVIMELFSQDEEDSTFPVAEPEPSCLHRGPISYEEFKEFITEEKAFLRELRLVKKVFRAILEKMCPAPVPGNGVSPDEMAVLFGDIDEIHNTVMNFVDSLEDAMEMDSQSGGGWMGVRSVFEDIIEAQEFYCFRKYAVELLQLPEGQSNPTAFETLQLILRRPFVERFLKSIPDSPGLLDAFRFVLPKLLMSPVFRVFQYVDFLRSLLPPQRIGPVNSEDAEVLQQAESILSLIAEDIDRMLTNRDYRRRLTDSHSRIRHRASNRNRAKLLDIFKSVEGWDRKENSQRRLDFVMEGDVIKLSTRDRRTDRHVFLFETCIVMCKKRDLKAAVDKGAPEYRFKESLPLHRTYIIDDKDDGDDVKWTFELLPRDEPSQHQTLSFRNGDDKTLWLGSMIMLQTRGMLDRLLEKTVEDEDRANPLRLPMQEMYPFAEPDSAQNLVLEDGPIGTRGVPLIKGATLIKLVERLTYHQYADPAFVKTFLITFRSFTTPHRLLELLIERFRIPLPTENGEQLRADDYNPALSTKRFRKEYCQPVQFRVLNVMRHWVDNHFLDFDSDAKLLQRLKVFLADIGETGRNVSMKKWIESISKIIERKEKKAEPIREITFLHSRREEIEWHLRNEECDLMTLHPKEIARQLTLIESEHYRAIKPSELIEWSNRDQGESVESTPTSLMRCIQFSNKMTHYMEKYVLMTENLEERAAVMSRLVDIMLEFEKINNFNGIIEIHSALKSSSLFRLLKTKELLTAKYANNARHLERLEEDCPSFDHGKNYFAKLRRINPPCIPFVGQYLTQLYFFDKGNASYLNGTKSLPNVEQRLINFNQRRRIADIVTEIQQYQYQPYNLEVEPTIRDFLLKLEDPSEGMDKAAFDDLLWQQSLKVEPRDEPVPRFPKRFHFNLRSPNARPSNIVGVGRSMSQAGSSLNVSAMMTSPTTHQRIVESGGDKSGSTPSTPHSESPRDVNPVYLDDVNGTLRVSVTAPDGLVPSSPLTIQTTASEPPPPIPPRNAKWSNSTSESGSPRDFGPKSSDSLTSARFPFPSEIRLPTSDRPPPPIPQRQNSSSTLTPDQTTPSSPSLPPLPQSASPRGAIPQAFFGATGTGSDVTAVAAEDDEDAGRHSPPPPLPPRRFAPRGSLPPCSDTGCPELPPKTLKTSLHQLNGVYRK